MKKTVKTVMMGVALLALNSWSLSAAAVTTSELEKRVSRLEKMAQNPVILQLLRRLETQEHEVQDLQDRMDRLQHKLQGLKKEADKRYAENDERISALETQIQRLKQPKQDEEFSAGDQLEMDSGLSDAMEKPTLIPSKTPLQPPVLPSQTKTDDGKFTVTKKADKKLVKSAKQQSSSMTQSPSKTQKSKVLQTHFPTPEEKLAYKAAFNLVKTAKYSAAIKAFEAFQKKYPESKLAANAAYWEGEVSLLQKHNKAALKAFDQVITHYPKSLKMADAMLRKADTLVLMDRVEEGKKLYQQILQQFPKSRAAKSVKKRLQVLDSSVEDKKAK